MNKNKTINPFKTINDLREENGLPRVPEGNVYGISLIEQLLSKNKKERNFYQEAKKELENNIPGLKDIN